MAEFSKGYDQFVTKIYSLKQLGTEYLLIVLHPEEQADGLIQPPTGGPDLMPLLWTNVCNHSKKQRSPY